MKRIILILLVIIPSLAYSQKDIFDESIEGLDKVDEFLIEEISSFSAFPQVHSNTIRVFKKILEISDLCKEQQITKNSLSSDLLSNYKVQLFYKKLNDIQVFAETFEELLRPFHAGNSSGLNENQMNIIDQLLRVAGWKITLLDINCKDAYFYEYQFKEFKMMFIKNALPKSNFGDLIQTVLEVEFTFDHYGESSRYNVGGGLYRMIQFKDDENFHYYKVIKARSVRI